MPDLLAFLRRVDCVVRQTGRDTLEASIPDVVDDRYARLELELYLRIWLALNPSADTAIVG